MKRKGVGQNHKDDPKPSARKSMRYDQTALFCSWDMTVYQAGSVFSCREGWAQLWWSLFSAKVQRQESRTFSFPHGCPWWWQWRWLCKVRHVMLVLTLCSDDSGCLLLYLSLSPPPSVLGQIKHPRLAKRYWRRHLSTICGCKLHLLDSSVYCFLALLPQL